MPAYTYRLCLTKDPANAHRLTQPPPGYDRNHYVGYFDDLKAGRLDQGRPGDAIEPLRRALRSDYLTKESAKALHYELGAANEALGDPEVALWYYQKVAAADPGYRGVAERVFRLGGGSGVAPGLGPQPEGRKPPGEKKARKR